MTNSKKTKGALLSSVVALLLCFAMLLGTTFAWFTDTKSTSVNTIQAGNLKVALEMHNGEKWVSAEGETLSFNGGLWEPGCTNNLPKLRIRNDGNLALKYKVAITGINGDAELNKAIEWTIGDVALGGEQHLAVGADNEFEIKGHMKESAGNEYQGLSIDSIAITVYATQDTVEKDGTGSDQYDKEADYLIPWDGETTTAPAKDDDGVYHITSAAELVYAMNNTQNKMNGTTINPYVSGEYILENNIDLGGATVKGFGNSSTEFMGTFDGNGHTISNFTINRADEEYYAGLFNYVKPGTIKNLTVNNATVIGQNQVGVIAGYSDQNAIITNCRVTNSIVIAQKKAGTVVGYTLGATVKDCSATNCTVFCANTDTAESGEVIGYENTGSTVENNTYKNVTVVRGATDATYVANGVAKNGSTYYIANAQGLKYCATTFTRADTTINKTFKLTADIDMSGIEWTPWCNEDQYFGGVFDGQGHTISNLTINDDHTAEDGHAVGFIGRLGANTIGQKELKNVTFDNAKVSGHHWVGVAVGYNEYGGVDNVRVTNSKVTATHVEGADSCGDKAGALIGMCGPNAQYITVSNCSATNCEVKAARHAAQLIGYGYANTTYSNLSVTNVTVSAIADSGCDGTGAGIVSANALVGNGTVDGLTIG